MRVQENTCKAIKIVAIKLNIDFLSKNKKNNKSNQVVVKIRKIKSKRDLSL